MNTQAGSRKGGSSNDSTRAQSRAGEWITYTRKKPSGDKKPASDKFPPHLPREVVEVAIPEAFQKLVDSGELIIKRYETTEALKQIPASLVANCVPRNLAG